MKKNPKYQKLEKSVLDASLKVWTLEYYLKDSSYWNALSDEEQAIIKAKIKDLIQQLERNLETPATIVASGSSSVSLEEPDDFE